MNQFIAKSFSFIITIIHALFFVSIIFVIIGYFIDQATIASKISIGGMPFILTLIIIVLLYVIITGILSTFISMNEYLGELVELTKKNNELLKKMKNDNQQARSEPTITAQNDLNARGSTLTNPNDLIASKNNW